MSSNDRREEPMLGHREPPDESAEGAKPVSLHSVRNASAVALATIEHLAYMFRDESAERPFLADADPERRRDALRSLETAERAVTALAAALRELRL